MGKSHKSIPKSHLQNYLTQNLAKLINTPNYNCVAAAADNFIGSMDLEIINFVGPWTGNFGHYAVKQLRKINGRQTLENCRSVQYEEHRLFREVVQAAKA